MYIQVFAYKIKWDYTKCVAVAWCCCLCCAAAIISLDERASISKCETGKLNAKVTLEFFKLSLIISDKM